MIITRTGGISRNLALSCPTQSCKYIRNAPAGLLGRCKCPKHRELLVYPKTNALSIIEEVIKVKNYGKQNNNGTKIKRIRAFEYENSKFRYRTL